MWGVLPYPRFFQLSMLQITQLADFSAGLRKKNSRLFHGVEKELEKIADAKPNWQEGIISGFWKNVYVWQPLLLDWQAGWKVQLD